MQDKGPSEGLAEELFVAHEAMKYRCNVSFPFGGGARYDLLIERGGEILKIQVKTASSCNDQNLLRQKIDHLDGYTNSKVDFFAGVVNLNEVDVDKEPSVDVPYHIFYKSLDDMTGQSARVNYSQPEDMGHASNQDGANLPQDYDFKAKIEPRLPQ
jgi:hypothetical protein